MTDDQADCSTQTYENALKNASIYTIKGFERIRDASENYLKRISNSGRFAIESKSATAILVGELAVGKSMLELSILLVCS